MHVLILFCLVISRMELLTTSNREYLKLEHAKSDKYEQTLI